MDREEAERRIKVAEAERLAAEAQLAAIAAKEAPPPWYSQINWTIIASIAVAAIGWVANAYIENVRSTNNLESSLILEAMKTPTQQESLSALMFFLEIGLIDDPDGKIEARATRKEGIPNLRPTSANLNIPRTVEECSVAGGVFTSRKINEQDLSLDVASCGAQTGLVSVLLRRISNTGAKPTNVAFEDFHGLIAPGDFVEFHNIAPRNVPIRIERRKIRTMKGEIYIEIVVSGETERRQ
mgnify:CR=1 FL=1